MERKSILEQLYQWSTAKSVQNVKLTGDYLGIRIQYQVGKIKLDEQLGR